MFYTDLDRMEKRIILKTPETCESRESPEFRHVHSWAIGTAVICVPHSITLFVIVTERNQILILNAMKEAPRVVAIRCI